MKDFIISLRLILLLLLLCSLFYPVLVWGVGRVAFPHKVEGSLIRQDGRVIGSELVGQKFVSPRYFHGRLSAVDYNAAGSGGSNLAPTNPALFTRMADSVTSAGELDDLTTKTIAFDRVTASGSGLDPHITLANALQQVARVARERGLPPDRVRRLVHGSTEGPLLGLIGPSRVHVLRLNLALDQLTSESWPNPAR